MTDIPNRRIHFINMAKTEYQLDVSPSENIGSIKKRLIDIIPEPYHISRIRFWIPGDVLKLTEPIHMMNEYSIQYYTEYFLEYSSFTKEEIDHLLENIHFFYIQLPDIYEQTTYLSPYLVWDAIDKQDMSILGFQEGETYTFRMFAPAYRSEKKYFDFIDTEGTYYNSISDYQKERQVTHVDMSVIVLSSRTWGGLAPAREIRRQWHSDVITLEYQLPNQSLHTSLQCMGDFIKGTFIGFQDVAKIPTMMSKTGYEYFGRIKLKGPFETFCYKGDNTTNDNVSTIPNDSILYIDFWYISPPEKKEMLGDNIDSSTLLSYLKNI